MRIDALLVASGLARSRAQAAELVRAGRVRVDGRVVAKVATRVDTEAQLTVARQDGEADLASRAGNKLAAALAQLGEGRPDLAQGVEAALRDARGCLDVGASTGGFTDVLLRRGAKHVIALDVGHGQLRPHLRADSRVTVLERTNIRDVDRAGWLRRTGAAQPPAFVVGDLSFISLVLVVPVVADLLDPGALALLLVKPQFEVGRERLAKDGVVRSAELRQQATETVVAAAQAAGLRELVRLPSAVPGATGNQETFVLFERTSEKSEMARPAA